MQTEIKMADGSKIQVDAEYDEARKQLVTDLRTFTECSGAHGQWVCGVIGSGSRRGRETIALSAAVGSVRTLSICRSSSSSSKLPCTYWSRRLSRAIDSAVGGLCRRVLPFMRPCGARS